MFTMINNSSKINMQKILSEYQESKDYMSRNTEDFQRLANLVDAMSVTENINKVIVGDSTIAGLVRDIPRNALRQLPVFSVVINKKKTSFYSLISSFILKDVLLNENTFGKGLLSTLQISAERALTFGFSSSMTATGSLFDRFGTSLKALQFEDVAIEPGVSDAAESSYFYTVAHVTRGKLKKIIKKAKAADSTLWNVKALEELLENPGDARYVGDFDSSVREEALSMNGEETFKIITRYESGPGAQFVTFSPLVTDRPLRVVKSRSKFGFPRVQFLVIDPDIVNPFGVSRARLASPAQNLLNIYSQNIATILLLNTEAPIFSKGIFTTPITLKKNALWQSSNPSSDVKIMSISMESLDRFVNLAQYWSGQIQNIMGGQTMTINAGSKASGFSKTAPGVKQSQEFHDIQNQQITKILENYLKQYSLSSFDTFLSEQDGDYVLTVDDETMNKVNDLAKSRFVPDELNPVFVPPIDEETNKIKINWNDLYDAIESIEIEVDVSLSPDELKDKERQDLQDTFVALTQNPAALQNPQARSILNQLISDKTPLVPEIPDETAMPVDPAAMTGGMQ